MSSPPHKRVRHDCPSSPTAMSTSATPVNVSVTEAPVNAMLPGAVASSSSTSSDPAKANAKKQDPKGKGKMSKRKMRRTLPDEYSAGDVLFRDVRDFLGAEYVDEVLARKDGSEWEAPEGLEAYSEVTLRVGAFTVSGESLSPWPQAETSDSASAQAKWAILTPFAHPGDLIRVKVIKHDRLYSSADLLEIIEYSEAARGGEGDRRVNPEGGCRYFGECGGCQLQPVPYQLQLAHKKTTVTKAYARFSGLSPAEMPPIQDTIGSPKQWGYRTKITPHFDAMPKFMQAALKGGPVHVPAASAEGGAEEQEMNGQAQADETDEVIGGCKHVRDDEAARAKEEGRGTKVIKVGEKEWELRIGFERKGRPGVMDIEECPIATPTLNAHLLPSRSRIQNTISTFKRGATILLRDSLPAPLPPYSAEHPFDPTTTPVIAEEDHVPITDHHASVYERVGEYMFEFVAGSFFQNNNSILVPLLEYVREAIFPAIAPSAAIGGAVKPPTHLVDTYCGSGLFGISLSAHFDRIAGVEISDQSIRAAKRNAEINGLQRKTSWLVGKAEEIFGGLEGEGFKGMESCVVVDPPRKGCDTPFLLQLLEFAPQTIVYVSCNVHTQARDVGWFVREAEKRGGGRWVVESVRGFDLFPQTAHVESVAVLRLDPASVPALEAYKAGAAARKTGDAAKSEEDALNA